MPYYLHGSCFAAAVIAVKISTISEISIAVSSLMHGSHSGSNSQRFCAVIEKEKSLTSPTSPTSLVAAPLSQ
jgi:hypothetical protein